MNRILALTLVATLAFAGDDEVQSEYATRLAVLKADDVAARFQLALWCAEHGLQVEARQHHRIVVTFDPDHRASRRALGFENIGGRWVAGNDVMRAKGFVQHDGVWLTPEEYRHYAADKVEAEAARAARLKGNAAIKMAWSPDATRRQRAMGMIEEIDAKYRLRPLAIAARINYPDVRRFAVDQLGGLDSEEALPPLYKRAIFDNDEGIRKAAAAAIRETDAKGKIGPFVRALQSPFDSVRLHAIQALQVVGDPGAVGPLVARYSVAGGSGQLVYLTQVNQVSYVQDFDVEVAQTSFIADPVIGVVQDGLVHAFRVMATNGFFDIYEEPALVEALSSLSGKEFGKDKKQWIEYYRNLQLEERRKKARELHERRSNADG